MNDTFDERLKLAYQITQEITGDSQVRFVFLVGSLSQGRASKDSDIDFGVILEGSMKPDMVCEWREGQMIGYEYFALDKLKALPKVPLLDELDLRETGRLVNGKILYSTGKEIDNILERLRLAVLHPTKAKVLFELSKHGIDLVKNNNRASVVERAWALQGVLSALAVLSLSLTTIRFQKPKWVVQDLHSSPNPELIDVIRLAFPPQVHDAASAEVMMQIVELIMQQGFNRLGVSNVAYTHGEDYDRDYVYRTYADARSLFQDQQWTACGFTVMTSVRLLFKLLSNREKSFTNAAMQMEEYRETLMRQLLSDEQLTIETCSKVASILEGSHNQIFQIYAERFAQL